MSIREQSAHRGQTVEIGGLGLGVASETADPIIQIVYRDEQDIRLSWSS